MRADVQKIFKKTPVEKQVMMFTATLPEETKIVAVIYGILNMTFAILIIGTIPTIYGTVNRFAVAGAIGFGSKNFIFHFKISFQVSFCNCSIS